MSLTGSWMRSFEVGVFKTIVQNNNEVGYFKWNYDVKNEIADLLIHFQTWISMVFFSCLKLNHNTIYLLNHKSRSIQQVFGVTVEPHGWKKRNVNLKFLNETVTWNGLLFHQLLVNSIALIYLYGKKPHNPVIQFDKTYTAKISASGLSA